MKELKTPVAKLLELYLDSVLFASRIEWENARQKAVREIRVLCDEQGPVAIAQDLLIIFKSQDVSAATFQAIYADIFFCIPEGFLLTFGKLLADAK